MRYDELQTREPYGYWISSTGELHTIMKSMGHDDYIKDVTGNDTDHAINTGWVRVIAPRHRSYWNLECSKNITNEAISTLRRLLTDDQCYIDLSGLSLKTPNKKTTITVINMNKSGNLYPSELYDRFAI